MMILRAFARLWMAPSPAESVAMTRDEIIKDGRELAAIAPNVVVKVPTMIEGLAATKVLASRVFL